MANVSFNPGLTTSPAGTFTATTQGYIQGDFANDDPAIRLSLASGVVASTVTQPVWGGMAISESLTATGEGSLGNSLALATTVANTTGFSVFTQGYNMVQVPGNSVQVSTSGMTIPFFRTGSKAQIKVKCSSALLTAVESGLINQQVEWDYTNQQLIPYASGTALPVQVLSASANSQVVSYDSGTGAVSWAAGNVAVILI